MAPGGVFTTGTVAAAPYQTSTTNVTNTNVFWLESEIDLRGMLTDDTKAFNMLTNSVQEAGPWRATTTEADPLTPTYLIYDVISAVQLDPETIRGFSWDNYPLPGQVPGFLLPTNYVSNRVGPDQQELNPTQIIWGRWRQWCCARDLPKFGSDAFGTTVSQSGSFGSGEVMVQNQAYYYRIIFIQTPGTTVSVPSANIAIWAEIVKLSEGAALTQLSRLVQR